MRERDAQRERDAATERETLTQRFRGRETDMKRKED